VECTIEFAEIDRSLDIVNCLVPASVLKQLIGFIVGIGVSTPLKNITPLFFPNPPLKPVKF